MHEETINGFRLSPQQGRLWSLQQDNPAYRTQCAILLDGNLHIETLRQALQKVVTRHEILRTTFPSLPGMKIPVQVITNNNAPTWHDINLGDCSPEEQEGKIEELFKQEQRRPFDFKKGPVLHVSLLALSAHKHVLLISLPSLCADTWSMKNLIHEISQTYDAGLIAGQPADEMLQYVQFSEWQNELLEDEDAETGKAFWRNQDLSAFPALALPFESKSGKTSFEPDSISLGIDRDLETKLTELAEKANTSPDVFLLACWQTLLWRLTGQSDIVVGDACNGRQHEMLHNAMGLFAKWVPIHCHFDGSFKFSEILSQIDVARRNAYEWQEYFTWDGRSEHDSEQAFFPVGFEFDERPAEYRANGLLFSIHKQHSCAERFNLKLSCQRGGGSLTAEFHFNSDHLQIEDVKRVARQFETLVQSVVNDVDAPVSELEILSKTELHRLLVEFNTTKVDYPQDKCIHQLFEEQVERTPENIAVAFGEQQLCYAELNARANQLAHHLSNLGVGPEVVVGLCMERSLEMIVGIFGILKAGGAYLPLDPMYPKQRLAFMLTESQAPVLLTQEQLVPQLTTDNNQLSIICLDAGWETIARESIENPASGTIASNLAYVIYTSGSTGKPKGVMIQHSSAANLAMALDEKIYAHQDSALKVSLNAPLVFDASVKQVLQLLYGRTLHILPEEVRPDGAQLLSYVRRHALDVLDCTPAQLRLMLAAASAQESEQAPSLALIGGEALDEATWKILADNGKTDFHNVYGPTECTVDAAVSSPRSAPQEPTIGRPIPNAQIYLLDKRVNPVPIGIPGELHIAGAGLARGYLNRPELTAEKFIPNRFSDRAGARFYKSGDLASYLSDGNIKFIGRRDHQVKLRGFRIEPGEIEALLTEHNDVHESVVMVREDTPEDPRLVAYVVLNKGSETSINELRSFLREKLPEFMVPSAIATLDALPLTRNGKVDRKALPVPERLQQQVRAAYVAPGNKIEQTIAKIWQEVLEVKKIGVDDNFFDLGGHSLLMVQVHNKMREALNKDISLIDLFRNPTVSMLAKFFSDGQPNKQASVQKARDRAAKRKRARNRQTRTTIERSKEV